MLTVTVAGGDVPDPLSCILEYVRKYPATLWKYDFGGQGDPESLAREDVARTRVIGSRISNVERDWFLMKAAERTQLWQAIPADARLADADPKEVGGLYDGALALFGQFAHPGRKGVAYGKISKVLHLKRPGLFPILDSRLVKAYRQSARDAARCYRLDRPGVRFSYWAAIRKDLINPANVVALKDLRETLRKHPNELVRLVADLTDVRLLDLLVWEP